MIPKSTIIKMFRVLMQELVNASRPESETEAMNAIVILRDQCNEAIAALDKQIRNEPKTAPTVQPIPPTNKKKLH